MTAVALICGAGVGLGLVVIVASLRGALPVSGTSRAQRTVPVVRITGAASAGVLVGGLTGWPVGALLAAGFAWWAPRLVEGRSSSRAAIARTEAVASWA